MISNFYQASVYTVRNDLSYHNGLFTTLDGPKSVKRTESEPRTYANVTASKAELSNVFQDLS